MKHVTVYREPGVYAGWPANHGAWQWGNEFLVGFMRGQYARTGMHNIKWPYQKVLSRSLDGGLTWTLEIPNVDFEARDTEPAPEINFETDIIRVCGNYDHGGEECTRMGGFYLSSDRGRDWFGAFDFKINLKIHDWGTSRTCVIPNHNLVFLSAAHMDHWGSDWIYCAINRPTGLEFLSVVCEDDARAVMPAAVAVAGTTVVVARRRGTRRPGGWIDAFVSEDGGHKWHFAAHVADTGIHNGNPPALIEHNGVLYCAYANRSDKAVFVNTSNDLGASWHQTIILRKGECSDIGYPRLFKRTDGQLVCVYYWAQDNDDQQHIEATIFGGK